MDLYSASSRSASNVLPLPVHRCSSPQASLPARNQRTLRDHGYGLVYHTICLLVFTLPAFAGYSFVPNHRGLVLRCGDLPSRDDHPPRHWPSLSQSFLLLVCENKKKGFFLALWPGSIRIQSTGGIFGFSQLMYSPRYSRGGRRRRRLPPPSIE